MKTSIFNKSVLFVFFLFIMIAPAMANAAGNNDCDNGHSGSSKNAQDGIGGRDKQSGGSSSSGSGASVPVNGGMVFLTIGGVVYLAAKFKAQTKFTTSAFGSAA